MKGAAVLSACERPPACRCPAQVRQLVDDLGDVERVNEQLDKIGHNIGARIVDEFLARSGTERCARCVSTRRGGLPGRPPSDPREAAALSFTPAVSARRWRRYLRGFGCSSGFRRRSER